MLLALAALGCAGGWDAEGWARSRPELAGRPLGRLVDATPYLLAADDTLVLFWCRWPLDAPLRVALPPDATPHERELLDLALRAWEAAVDGLRFEVARQDAPLRLRFRDDGPEGARTAAECRVELPLAEGARLEARLVRAELTLRRAEGDAWGRPVPLGEAELLGSAVHELGHALGLQGHARRGDSALRLDAHAVRRLGRRLLAGDPLREPALAALYAVPSGSVVERRRLPAGATARLDLLAGQARRRGRTALELRVGDRAARVRWAGPGPEVIYYLKDPAKLVSGRLDFRDSLRPAALP